MAATQMVRSERFPDLGDEVLFPRLSDAKLAWLAKRGKRRTFQPVEVRSGASKRVASAVGGGGMVVRYAHEVLAG